MSKIWLLGGCLLLVLPALGQGRDTVLAVHKLFWQQRPKGAALAATGAAPLVPAGLGSSAASAFAGRLTVAAVSGGVAAGVGALQAHRYSAEREALILEQYAQGVPIPADVRRRLNRRMFRRTAADLRHGF